MHGVKVLFVLVFSIFGLVFLHSAFFFHLRYPGRCGSFEVWRARKYVVIINYEAFSFPDLQPCSDDR